MEMCPFFFKNGIFPNVSYKNKNIFFEEIASDLLSIVAKSHQKHITRFVDITLLKRCAALARCFHFKFLF
jgi:hypothetical protein